MPIDDSREQLRNRVRESADIVEVISDCLTLKRAGRRFTGLCPFHGEKTPSFSVNPQGQFFHCFGCGESGDVFAFVMKYHHLDFPEALKFLAKKYGIAMPQKALSEEERRRLQRRDQLFAANEAAAMVYQQALAQPKLGERGRAYLEQRGLPEDCIARYRLGYAPSPDEAGWNFLEKELASSKLPVDILEEAGLLVRKERGGGSSSHYDRFRSRIMFPIIDMTGRVVAFGGRILGEGQPKYMNSPETPIFEKSRLLFGLYPHREAIRKARNALVVEGNFDLLMLAAYGIDHVVAPLGTALTRAHIHSLRGYADELVLLFDADAAGLNAAMRSIPLFLAEQVEGRVALLPAGHDPDSYVRSEGPDALRQLAGQGRPLAEFAFETLVREHGLSLAGKSRIVARLNEVLAEASDGQQRDLMLAHFSEKLGVAPSYFQGRSAQVSPPQAQSQTGAIPAFSPARPSWGTLPRHERQLIDFLLLFPEYFTELRDAGAITVLQHPVTAGLFQLLSEASLAGYSQPEQLFDLMDDAQQEAYVSQVLMRKPQFPAGEEEEYGRQMCDELLLWLQGFTLQKARAELQQRIREAERLGDQELLATLMREKMDLGQKNATGV